MSNGWEAHCTLVTSLIENGLQAINILPEFKALEEFELKARVLVHDDFWKSLFAVCCALCASMHVL
jgi:hypothetical protein